MLLLRNKKFFYFQDILINLVIIGGERLRIMKLALMLVLLASLASLSDAASSSGSVGLDIIGSEAEDARIISPGGGPVEVDIIGSTATNIQIGAPDDQDNCLDCGGVCYCGECYCGYTTIWDDFTRPLCYPWSSYIPTRYNKPFHIDPYQYNAYQYNGNSAAYEYNGYPVAYLGKYYQDFQ